MIGLMTQAAGSRRATDPHNSLQGKRCNMFAFVPA
jgi:hypothetical protein